MNNISRRELPLVILASSISFSAIGEEKEKTRSDAQDVLVKVKLENEEPLPWDELEKMHRKKRSDYLAQLITYQWNAGKILPLNYFADNHTIPLEGAFCENRQRQYSREMQANWANATALSYAGFGPGQTHFMYKVIFPMAPKGEIFLSVFYTEQSEKIAGIYIDDDRPGGKKVGVWQLLK